MKVRRFRIVQSVAFSLLLATAASANNVSVDTSFNGTGYSIRPAIAPPERAFVRAFVVQPDGKIVIAGDTWGGGSYREKLAVMRMNADGTLDTTFGTGGSVLTLVDNAVNASRVILQPDGKILICGWSYLDNQRYNMIILRYTANGVLDTTFNQTGYSVVHITGESFDYGTDLGLLSDGKIVVLGNTAPFVNLPRDHVLLRYNTDGTLDSTFNGTGILVLANPTDESANDLIIQPGDKILIGGHRHNGTRHEYLLMRFNADGTADSTFGTGGTTTTPANTGDSVITTMDLRPDGKIVVMGWGKLARYSADGILDQTFGSGGIVTLPQNAPGDDIRVLANNKMLISGGHGFNTMRLMPNGALDYHFNGGRLFLNIPGQTCFGRSAVAQDNDKILAVGYCSADVNQSSFAAVRFKETRTKRFMDFSGDGGTEMAMFRPTGGQWLYSNGTTPHVITSGFGLASDIPVPADFTGDGRTDVAVFRPSTGEWLVLGSDFGTMYSYPFGAAGDIPVTSDFDGDNVTDHAVYRPSTGTWWINRSTEGLLVTSFGTSGDKPVSSDFDGDFKADIAIFRPSMGQWWIQRSTDGSVYAFQFGASTDITVQGEYTGDNKTDAAFYRPSTGHWFILRSEDYSYYSHPFGLSEDIPVPGHYYGDARFDYVIFRPSVNTWHVLANEGTLYFNRQFGANGDVPIASRVTP